MSTLIEKLEQEKDLWDEVYIACDLDRQEIRVMIDDAINGCIDIVKQHSDWISVDERLPPDNMMVLAYCHIRKATGYAFVSHQQAWSFYYFTKNSENQALAMVNDISKWMPIPQPPSEVQP